MNRNRVCAHPFDVFLKSPGLYWIGEFIFIDLLDYQTFSKCELVCQAWRDFFINAEIWKKKLLKKIAPLNSYRRFLLQTQLDLVDHETYEDAHKKYRSLAFKFTSTSIRNSWQNGSFSVKKINSFPIVRDMKTMNVFSNKIIVANSENISISLRDEFMVDILDSNSQKLRILNEFKGHRREVTCLDFDEVLYTEQLDHTDIFKKLSIQNLIFRFPK